MQNALDRLFSHIANSEVAGMISRLMSLAGCPEGGRGVQFVCGVKHYMGLPEQYYKGWLRGNAMYTVTRGLVYRNMKDGHFGKWEVPPHILKQHAAEMRAQARRKMLAFKTRYDDLDKADMVALVFEMSVDEDTSDGEGMSIMAELEEMTRTELIRRARELTDDRGQNMLNCEFAESVVNSYVLQVLDYCRQDEVWSSSDAEYRLTHRKPRLRGMKAIAEAVFKADFARRSVAHFDPLSPSAPRIGFATRGTNNAEYYVTIEGVSRRVPYGEYKKTQAALHLMRCQGLHNPPVAAFVTEPTPRTWGDTLSDHPNYNEPARVFELLEVANLSPREKEVFGMSCRGYSKKQIAETLGISQNTVGPLVSRATEKMKSADVRKAFEHGPGKLDLEIDRGTPTERVRPMMTDHQTRGLSRTFLPPAHPTIHYIEAGPCSASESPAAMAAIEHAKVLAARKAEEAERAKERIRNIKTFVSLDRAG